MVLIGIPFNNARLRVERRMQRGFDQVGLRFEATKELWRSELRRVEEIRDARLKHLETK